MDGAGCDCGPGRATFNDPMGLGLTHEGDILFVADQGNHVIRRILLSRGPEGDLRPEMGGSCSVDTLIISGTPMVGATPSTFVHASCFTCTVLCCLQVTCLAHCNLAVSRAVQM